jgi:hypothetical protein
VPCVLDPDRVCDSLATLRARGHSYGRALRGDADRMLGIACVLLQRRELFNPQHGMTATTA